MDKITIDIESLVNKPRLSGNTLADLLRADSRLVVSGVVMQYDPDTLELVCVRELGNLREVVEWLATPSTPPRKV